MIEPVQKTKNSQMSSKQSKKAIFDQAEIEIVNCLTIL
jgi:hypothetical protein